MCYNNNVVCLAIIIGLLSFTFSCNTNHTNHAHTNKSAVENVHSHYLQNIVELDIAVGALLSTAERTIQETSKDKEVLTSGFYAKENGSPSTKEIKKLQDQFLAAKIAYKKTEFLTELYFPYTAKSLNGPPVEEVEIDDPNQIIVNPEGFQVIETMLFPTLSPADCPVFLGLLKQLSSNVGHLKAVTKTTSFTDSHIFMALRLETFRIISMGISGFDSPAAYNSIKETKTALQEIKEVLEIYQSKPGQGNTPLFKNTFVLIENAESFLLKNQDFIGFDRLKFITQFLNPLTTQLLHIQNELNIESLKGMSAIKPSAKTLFDSGAFDLSYFAPNYNRQLTPQKIALGELLFFDPVLSGDKSRSCASCHQPGNAFTDGLPKSIAFNRKGQVFRNAPSMLNAGLQASLFHDGRVAYLEDQVTDVVLSPLEMHGSFEEAVQLLENSSEYKNLFIQAFEDSANVVDEKKIRMALASYVRSKIAMNSRFDQYMRGDSTTLTQQEKQGFNLFMGKAACGTCHFLPLFNGTVPPGFRVTEAEKIGVPDTNDTLNMHLDKDVGKFDFTRKELHKFSFKTSTIRNVALTAPYMHNGVFRDLEEVMDFYNHGGGEGRGLIVPHQTLAPDALNLSDKEVKAVIAFMGTLSDTVGLTNTPKKLPILSSNIIEQDHNRKRVSY